LFPHYRFSIKAKNPLKLSSKMTWTKLETCAVLSVVCLFATAYAGGSKGYGDECIIGLVAGLGVGNEADTCKDDQNLVCLGNKCGCNPAGYVHQSGFLGLEFLGGGCKLRSGIPCSDSGTSCVSHATCNKVCVCDEGYHTGLTTGDCTNGAMGVTFSNSNFLLLIPALASVLCYFRYWTDNKETRKKQFVQIMFNNCQLWVIILIHVANFCWLRFVCLLSMPVFIFKKFSFSEKF